MLNILSLGNQTLKQQYDTITHLLGWLKSKNNPHYQMAMRITQQQEHSFIWGSNEQICIEDNLASSYKAKHNLLTPATHCAPRHISTLSENLHPHENLSMNNCNCFIHKCPKLEANKKSFSR